MHWERSNLLPEALVEAVASAVRKLTDEQNMDASKLIGGGMPGEIGHSTIDPNGKLCECGKRGCLQTYITDLALLQEAGQIKPVGSVGELYRLMHDGETWAFNIIDRACTYIAITINNVVCTYNPDTIVMAGSFIDIDPAILERVKGKLEEFIREPFVGTFKLTRSQLGEQAIMIGAAKLALQRYLGNGLQQQ
ncbi:ROK family protein [Paenibacillus sp. GCM10023250]|uniref:ROK family protein n=1 Tax=Paenibacillus sp. GCM10023250 TaxID=3252648 RepID=UPI00361703F2